LYSFDDENEGQKGCEGSCDSSKYSITRNVLCDKCKEGYYNIEGICLQCSIGSPNCTNCSYEAYEGSDKKYLNALNVLMMIIGYLKLMENVVLALCHPIV